MIHTIAILLPAVHVLINFGLGLEIKQDVFS